MGYVQYTVHIVEMGFKLNKIHENICIYNKTVEIGKRTLEGR